jgi:hypothetical protein
VLRTPGRSEGVGACPISRGDGAAAAEVFTGQVAQLVEHSTENRSVGGSIPSLAMGCGSERGAFGGVPGRKRPVRWAAQLPSRNRRPSRAKSNGSSSIGRAPVSKTGGWGFDSLLPCSRGAMAGGRLAGAGVGAHVAQSVEHFLGKEEVTGSNPVVGSRPEWAPIV